MAIEDGVVLGRCIGIADSFGEAFARYETARKERANGVQLASRRRARALQGTDPAGHSSVPDSQGLGLLISRAYDIRHSAWYYLKSWCIMSSLPLKLSSTPSRSPANT